VRLIVRPDYWVRRRGQRSRHCNAIIWNAKNDYGADTICILSDNFAVDLREELFKHGIDMLIVPSNTKTSNTRRRIVL
jgi:hypothetical protein